MILFSILTLSLTLQLGYAEDDIQQTLIGENRAVLEYSPQQGMTLSSDPIKKIGIKTSELKNDYTVSKSALIYELNSIGIYIKNGKWFRFELVTTLPSKGNTGRIILKNPVLSPGTQIVTEGAALLRLAELNIKNPGAEDD